MKAVTVFACALALFALGCKKSSSTTTTATTPTQTPANPSIVEMFTGTLDVGGTSIYDFAVSQYGTVDVRLASIGGAGVPPTVNVNLTLGTPADDGSCTTAQTQLVKAGSATQLTTTEQPGQYCVSLNDPGNLFARANFTVVIAHP
jgi:hypothetical protein